MESNWVLREVLFDEDGNPIAHREPIKPTGIIKIAINITYGGFDLSKAARDRYKELTGEYPILYEVARDDKVLIQVVEELGVEKAGDSFAKLKIVEVPVGTDWEIIDIDGLEFVVDRKRVWGLVWRVHD
jgi:hypothetical protein